MVCVKTLSCWQHGVSMFVGIISGKPSRNFTHPLGCSRGLKGLLHMLNATVSPTKEDLCFLLWFCFSFCFAKGLAKCKFWGIWWVTNIVSPYFAFVKPLVLLFYDVFLLVLVFCRSLREKLRFLSKKTKNLDFLEMGSSTALLSSSACAHNSAFHPNELERIHVELERTLPQQSSAAFHPSGLELTPVKLKCTCPQQPSAPWRMPECARAHLKCDRAHLCWLGYAETLASSINTPLSHFFRERPLGEHPRLRFHYFF